MHDSSLHQRLSDLETLRKLIAEGERYMTRAERLDWYRRVASYKLRTKEHTND